MILDTLINLEDRFINSKRKLPKTLKIQYSDYCKLVKELDKDTYLSSIHGLSIVIIPTTKLVLE